ncbi:MAG: hypothetical protein KDA57_04100 [Planctomycetales bacterium]|nr:hypothetical protein [Planctomycetales bacterium]
MASNNRAAQISKVLKVVRRNFKPVEPPKERSLLEHLLFSCCLETSLHEPTEKVFESLSQEYYDWNEVRVTSIRELTDLMKPLNDPLEAATRLKRVLQSVFETHYSFDLEPLKKQNIGQTTKQLQKYNGSTDFTVSYVTQNALGGHSIPVNQGLLTAMQVVGVISESEAKQGRVPGLERAVPKSKGIEVGSLLHQLGVELQRSPYGPGIRKILLEIDPDCKSRLPKRVSKKAEQEAKEAEAAAKAEATAKAAAAKAAAEAKAKSDSSKKEAAAVVAKKKKVAKAAAKVTSVGKKKTTKKKAAPKKVVKKKKKVAKSKPAKKVVKKKKKTTTKRPTKRKPR